MRNYNNYPKLKYVCPVPAETMVTGNSVCTISVNHGGDCPVSSFCSSSVAGLQRLRRVYGHWIKSTLTEFTSSIVVRSEHQLNEDLPQRLSLRKHFYEVVSSSSDLSGFASSVLQCEANNGDEEFGRYLGFVDLRPTAGTASIATGLFVPPRSLRHDRKVQIATGEYGPLFGGPSFQCTIYSMQEPEACNSYCSHVSVFMALGALADRRAQIVGNYTLSYLAGARRETSTYVSSDAKCLVKHNRWQPSAYFCIEALTPDDVVSLLEKTGLSAIHARFPYNDVTRRLLERLLEVYVIARCPAILFVDILSWWPTQKERLLEDARNNNKSRPDAHSVNVVGIRRSETLAGISSLIVHDPGYQPYYARAFDECVEALQEYMGEDGGKVMHVVFAGTADIKCHAVNCVGRGLRKLPEDRRLFPQYYESHDGKDYDLGHIHSDDVASVLLPLHAMPLTSRSNGYCLAYKRIRSELFKIIKRLPRGWYWTVTGRGRDRAVEVIWIFSASTAVDYENPDWCVRACMPDDEDITNSVSVSEFGNSLLALPPLSAVANDVCFEDAGTPADTSHIEHKCDLQISVISSCSDQPLSKFLHKLKDVSRVQAFDLYLLRDVDLQQLDDDVRNGRTQQIWTTSRNGKTTTELLATADIEALASWIAQSVSSVGGMQIAALATYLPSITSLAFDDGRRQERRKLAISALANAARLAALLSNPPRAIGNQQLMRRPIIELVCGGVTERCNCKKCNENMIWEYETEAKIEVLIDSIAQACVEMEKDVANTVLFALELEPGESYAFHELDALHVIDSLLSRPPYQHLRDHVGINVDIAHMIAAGISHDQLAKFAHLFVHSHICDLPPFMHTRDQPVGTWCPLNQGGGDHLEFLRLLSEESSEKFSGYVALELEGCSRENWIHQSTAALRQILNCI
jgi:hypothetical protein